VHNVDKSGSLKDVEPDGDKAPWQKAIEKRKPKEVKSKERLQALENAIEACKFDEPITVIALEEYMGLSKNSVKARIKEHGEYEIENGIIKRLEGVKKQKTKVDSDV
jgi:hypothetical protein